MKKILLAAALVASCGVASAQGYAGAVAGISQFSVDCLGLSCDKSDTAFKVYGGYALSPELSVEVAYTDFGQIKIGGVAGLAEATAWSVVAAYRLSLATDLVGVGRLGLGIVSAEARATNGGLSYRQESSGANLYAGLGLEYAVNKDFKVVGAVDLADNGDVYMFGLGAQVGF